MKVFMVPSSVSERGEEQRQFLTSYLVNDTLAIDAGSIGFYGTPDDQARVRHVLLSHSHIDHVASLPVFVENVFEDKPDCVTVHASAAVLDSLQRDLFNDRVWPDFIGLSAKNKSPFLKTQVLDAGKPVMLEGLRITPIPVQHVVPTFGFLIEDDHAAVIISSDTGPTSELWQVANRTPNLRAVFLEVTFPDNLAWLAKVSEHLTPGMFGDEAKKVTCPVRFIAVHLKARYRDQVAQELLALGLPTLEIGKFGKTYTF